MASIVTCEKDYINFLGIRITTAEELKAALKQTAEFSNTNSFQCSSSLDWPEDYTNNAELIYLCDLIRGNNVSGKNPEYKGLEVLFLG